MHKEDFKKEKEYKIRNNLETVFNYFKSKDYILRLFHGILLADDFKELNKSGPINLVLKHNEKAFYSIFDINIDSYESIRMKMTMRYKKDLMKHPTESNNPIHSLNLKFENHSSFIKVIETRTMKSQNPIWNYIYSRKPNEKVQKEKIDSLIKEVELKK